MKKYKYLLWIAIISCLIFIIATISLISKLDEPSSMGKDIAIILVGFITFIFTLKKYNKKYS
ncbi:hypothetical protein [Dethiothermospora halolimnae]|uniref:hypothetical protein n=1 Tax=Dethiothermospora halolimnae TaxID=3114390 RepID=UPI003CCBB5A9